MTAKKAQARKKQRLKKKIPRTSFGLKKVEAEIMFIIWKGGTTSLTYSEIAARHAAYFGGPKRKDVTVRGIIFDIRLLEKATDRKYLQPSGRKPEKFKVDTKGFVDLQWTAIILLELDRGYPHIERQISCDGFEQYLSDKYGWDKGFIAGRIEYLQKSQYISIYNLGGKEQFVGAEARLEDDLYYLILVVEDYYRERKQEDSNSPIVRHLRNLIALYRSDNKPVQAKGGNT